MEQEQVKSKNYKKLKEILEKNWGKNVSFKDKTIWLTDNKVLSEPEFIQILRKFKVFVQPNLLDD